MAASTVSFSQASRAMKAPCTKLASFDGLKSSVSFSNSSSAKCVRAAQTRKGASQRRVEMSAVRLPVYTLEGETAGEVALDLKSAKPETAKAVVHRAVVTHLQNQRRGTASTKTRAEVRGGGRKPYKQKGTGRARLGSLRTPLRPGGGVVFGPKPVDWTIKINKKEKQLAISTALQSASVNMIVVEDFKEDFEKPRTKDFVQALAKWGVDYKEDYTLLLALELPQNVYLSSRNIERLNIVTAESLNIYDVLRADKLVVTVSAVEYLNQRFGKGYSLEGFEDGQEVVLSVASDGTISVAAVGAEEESQEVEAEAEVVETEEVAEGEEEEGEAEE